MRKRNPDQNKLKKFVQTTISLTDIVNLDDALSRVYFSSAEEKEDPAFLSMVMKDLGRGKQFAIYVVPVSDGHRYQLIYGQKRLYAAIKSGFSSVIVNILPEDLTLDWDAVKYLYENDFASRNSYDKGKLFSDILTITRKKFEVLALETGLPYHTLRSLDSAYKTARKYPSLGEAYQEEKVHQGIVNLAASLYKQLPPDDQKILTDYLIANKDDGVERLKNAVKSREDIPVRDRIIGYIKSDFDAVAAGKDRPLPEYSVAPEDILTPLLPGDEEGRDSFTPMYGFSRDGIALFQNIYKETMARKEADAKASKTKTKKISKHVLKFFYLLCRDQMILIDPDNLLILDRLWQDDRFPKSAGKYFNNFESCYDVYKSLSEAYPMLFTVNFAAVVPVQDQESSVLYNSVSFSSYSEDPDSDFYQSLFRFISRTSYGVPEDQISLKIKNYCDDSERILMMRKMFETADRYRKARINVKKEIDGVLITI